MKRIEIEEIIQTCYAKGLTSEGNKLSAFLESVDKLEVFAEKSNAQFVKYGPLMRAGNTRSNVLESIYQGANVLIGEYGKLSFLE